MEYPKIKTIFKRESEKPCNIILGEYSTPEIEYLKDNLWVSTEKVNGTNIRVKFDPEIGVRFGGKTDNAQIPVFLLDRLTEMFPSSKFEEIFDKPITLYGEGYGSKIQKGGGKYKDHADFVLFDVRIDGWWLERNNIEDIASKLRIEVVPIICTSTLEEVIALVKSGLKSRWGDFIAEGLVCKPQIGLLTRGGKRIITKIKHEDFEKLKREKL